MARSPDRRSAADVRPGRVARSPRAARSLARPAQGAERSLVDMARALDLAPVGVLISRMRDGIFVYANAAVLGLLGYERAQVLGRTALEVGIWAIPDERRAMVEGIRAQGQIHNHLHALRLSSAAVVRGVISACLVRLDGEDHILGFLNQLRDLDSAFVALVDGAERVKQAERVARIGFWDWDLASDALIASPGLHALLDVPPGQTLDSVQALARHVLPQDRHLLEPGTYTAAGAPAAFPTIDLRVRLRDGSLRWVSWRGAATTGADGRLRHASGVAVDVTSRKEREQQLLLQAEIMNNMAEGVMLVRARDDKIVFANARFESLLGYRSGELLGHHVSIVNAGGTAEQLAVAEEISGTLRRKGMWSGEVHNRHKDGSSIWCLVNVSAFDFYSYGKVWVAVHSEFTQARQARLERDQALVALRSLSLRLQESIEAERRALARDVHDHLGASLTGMRMRLESLAADPPAERQLLQVTLAQLAQLAQSALSNSRELCNRLRPAILDDLGLLETCRWYLDDWEKTAGIRVQRRLAAVGSHPAVDTDLFRILQELLTNVARHSGATEVRVGLSLSRGQLVLRVQDNGRGLPANAQELGFGLLGVRERTRQHGGSLKIDASAAGTRVCARLQVAPEPAPPKPPRTRKRSKSP